MKNAILHISIFFAELFEARAIAASESAREDARNAANAAMHWHNRLRCLRWEATKRGTTFKKTA